MEDNKVTLIVLVWNELEALTQLWDRIPFNSVDETIFIDPGSDDGTIEFVRNKGYPIVIQKNTGRGNAFLEGLEHAKHDNIIFFSGDGNEDPQDIPKIAGYLNEGYDMVIAARHLLKGSQSDDSDDPLRVRKLGNMAYSWFIDLLWDSGVKDAINGFRGIKKESMRQMHLDAPKHEIELQTTIRAAKLGMKIKEFPTHELKRVGGKRKVTAATRKLGYRLGYFLMRELFIGKNFIKKD